MDLFRTQFKSHGIFFTCVRHTTPYDNGNDFCWVLLVYHSVYMLGTVSFIQTWIYFREGRNSTDLCYYFRFYLENYVLGYDIFWSVRNLWMFLRSLLLLSSIFWITFLNSVSQILLLWNLFGNILNTTLNKHFIEMFVFVRTLNAEVWIIPYYISGSGLYCTYVMWLVDLLALQWDLEVMYSVRNRYLLGMFWIKTTVILHPLLLHIYITLFSRYVGTKASSVSCTGNK